VNPLDIASVTILITAAITVAAWAVLYRHGWRPGEGYTRRQRMLRRGHSTALRHPLLRPFCGYCRLEFYDRVLHKLSSH
jgi:hypothetical protein